MKRAGSTNIQFLFQIFLAGLILSGCTAEKSTDTTLTLGLLPVLDTLPVYIAETEGLFEKAGIAVTILSVASPIERDQLMQAGKIDGMINELVSTAFFNRDEIRVKTILTARQAEIDSPVFRILGAPGSDLLAVSQLKGIPVGISENTIIEYLAYRILKDSGLQDDEINLVNVPAIGERFQLLMSGKIQAAILPDPLAQAALEAGATLVGDDGNYSFYSNTVLTFSTNALSTKKKTVTKFISAWNDAILSLNRNPGSYRDLLLTKIQVPESVKSSFNVPIFSARTIPVKEQWIDINEWMISKGLLNSAQEYDQAVSQDFVK